MIYQRLNPNDIPQLLLLMQQYKQSIGEPALNEEQVDKLKFAIEQNKIEFFVAKHDSKLIAMCSIGVVFSTAYDIITTSIHLCGDEFLGLHSSRRTH